MKMLYSLLATSIACLLMSGCPNEHKPAQAGTAAAPATGPSLNLVGSEWLLEDLGGSGVIDRVQATLSFPESGKAAGRGSCNRFFGSVVISGNTIKFSGLGSTKMACPEALMKQEDKYLSALQAAERFESSDGSLLIYYAGSDKPLRFTPMHSSTPANQDVPKQN